MEDGQQMVFVYGTLRKGGSNHHRVEGAKSLGEAWILGRLYVIDWYPGMVLDDEGIPVRGEVYAMAPEELLALDEFEGAEYKRLKASVNLQGDDSQEVWIYEFRGELGGKKELVPADWLQVRPEQSFSIFSVLTAALLLLTVGFGVYSWGGEIRGPGWIQILVEILAVAGPLAPFGTAMVAKKRGEEYSEGAELCAAIALLFFGTSVIVRYLPVLFGVFAN